MQTTNFQSTLSWSKNRLYITVPNKRRSTRLRDNTSYGLIFGIPRDWQTGRWNLDCEKPSGVTRESFLGGRGMEWSPKLPRPLLHQPRMKMDDDERGAIVGMRIVMGNKSNRRKPSSLPLCPPQIPHYITWAPTLAASVGSQPLTVWATARPMRTLTNNDTGEAKGKKLEKVKKGHLYWLKGVKFSLKPLRWKGL
jgi:hypothetical protein